MLSLDNKEIKLTVAKLADGTLVESETFDVGEAVEVIHEDGTKTPAPDGEHLLELRDESDEINRIKIFTEGGIIKERENVEIEATKDEDKQEEMADVSTEEVKSLPESGEVEETSEQVTLESEPGIAVDEEVVDKEADIVNLTTKLEEQEEKIEEMKERIEELVKYFEEIKKEEEELEEEEKKEEELESKRLDGAPTEKPAYFSKKKNNFKIGNYRNSVISKMYK
tara:strand:- start:481 stop:1155 length:675 start_codon:yes stop_codon:yes gene_type:complete